MYFVNHRPGLLIILHIYAVDQPVFASAISFTLPYATRLFVSHLALHLFGVVYYPSVIASLTQSFFRIE